jgi:hypothetical protein
MYPFVRPLTRFAESHASHAHLLRSLVRYVWSDSIGDPLPPFIRPSPTQTLPPLHRRRLGIQRCRYPTSERLSRSSSVSEVDDYRYDRV